MEFAAREVVLRDGGVFVLRSLVAGDGAAFAAHSARSAATSEFVAPSPGETISAERAGERAAAVRGERGELLVGVFGAGASGEGGAVVGSLALNVSARRKLWHVADLGMVLDEHVRGRGLGRALLGAALAWARAHPSLLKVELAVMAGNAAGLALYASAGFEREGVRPRRYRLAEGRFEDEIVMGLAVG